MDLIDKKILCELDQNCRQTASQIARKLKISRNVVAYRQKRFEEEGIISKYVCTLNLGKLGYRTYKLGIKLYKEFPEFEQKFLDFIVNNHHVINCVQIAGHIDYSLAVAVQSNDQLDTFITELKSITRIKECTISIVAKSKIYKLSKLLLGDQELKEEKYSGEEQVSSIDTIDKQLLAILSQQANISLVELAKKANISIDIASYRLKKLKTIILSNRTMMNLNKIGYYHHVILLNLIDPNKITMNHIDAWCSQEQRVMYYSKRIGRFDIAIHVAVQTLDEVVKLTNEISKHMQGRIDDLQTVSYTKLIKLNYVPWQEL